MDTSPALGGQELVIGGDDISHRSREPMHPGVPYTILWRQGRDAAGVMWLEAGAEVPAHRHDDAEHHVWLSEGRAHVDGRIVGPGSYWHVPAGVDHSVSAVRTDGATLFYLYLRR
jgi:mannose-6-phosphate isomerase-like protein (cupin superfamily)